jgi:selT/selW/selH-like putative selenoprotein
MLINYLKLNFFQFFRYRNVFEQFSQLVRTHYPGVEVVGENYPPPPAKALIARILSVVKMALLACLLLGQNPFALFNIPTPAVYSWALQNKMYACLMVFFFSNSIESHLVSTGAFEIYFNDVPLWSKLQTSRLPSANEFVQMLQTFAAKSEFNSAAHSAL